MREINRETLRVLRKEIDDALAPIARDYDISIKCGNGVYAGINGHLKVEIAIKDANGEVMSKDAQNFQSRAIQYGLKPENLGALFTRCGKLYKIVGLRPQSYKYPILVEEVYSKRMVKFPSESVRYSLDNAMRP